MISQFNSLSALLILFLVTISYSNASELTVGDSVGVERVGDKTFILHKVSPQETLFAISRKYQVPVGEIQNSNEVLKQGLKIGQTIRIPYIAKSELDEGTSLHKVAPGETLFSISKRYNITVDSLKQWNKLLGNDLSVGQALIVKETDSRIPVTTPSPTTASTTTVVTSPKPQPEVVEAKPKVIEKKTESEEPK